MPTPATLLNELLKDGRADKANIVGKLNKRCPCARKLLVITLDK
jgi:hypothetical protein